MDNGDPGRVWFDAVLMPHRSLSPRGFSLVMLTLGAASFAASLLFVLKGAWPVAGFFGLDVALVYLAFRANYRSGKNRETIRLTDRALEIARVSPYGRTSYLALEPSFMRVALAEFPDGDCRVSLHIRGRAIPIAAQLSAPERRSLAGALKEALFRRAQGFSLA